MTPFPLSGMLDPVFWVVGERRALGLFVGRAAATFLRSCQLTNRMAARIRCTTQTPAVNLAS